MVCCRGSLCLWLNVSGIDVIVVLLIRLPHLRDAETISCWHAHNKGTEQSDKYMSHILGKPKPPSRRVARLVKRKRTRFSSLFLSCEDYWDPSWPNTGDAGDRTGGLGPAKRKEHYLTAAPFHRFDVNKANWHQYKSTWLLTSLLIESLGVHCPECTFSNSIVHCI